MESEFSLETFTTVSDVAQIPSQIIMSPLVYSEWVSVVNIQFTHDINIYVLCRILLYHTKATLHRANSIGIHGKNDRHTYLEPGVFHLLG